MQMEKTKLAVGRVGITSEITLESETSASVFFISAAMFLTEACRHSRKMTYINQ